MPRQLNPDVGMTQTRPTRARIRILATTDLHMNLCGYDYHADKPSQTVGLTRTATLIRQARAEAAQTDALTLLFDNGDSLQGTPMGDYAAETDATAHPLMSAFSLLGYDAIGLGNHDFNFGLEKLAGFLRQAPCPVLSSNLRDLGGVLPDTLQRHMILERSVLCSDGRKHTLRIGVLSLLPPQTLQWDTHYLTGRVEIDDIVDTATRTIAQLRQEGSDIVIALAHTGVGPDAAQPGMENALTPLSALPGLDAVIGGHTHLPHAAASEGLAPSLIAGSAGSHLGVLDLALDYDAATGWRVTTRTAELRPIVNRDTEGRITSVVKEDLALSAALAPSHQATRTRMDEPLGYTSYPLHSYFTFFAPDQALAFVADAQAEALRQALKDPDAQDLPLLSAVAPGKFGGRSGPQHYTDIPAGPLRMRNVSDLHVFPNLLSAVVIDASGLHDWLEMSACLFNQQHAGQAPAPLINEDRAGHNFDVLHGVTYQIDLSQPAHFASDGARLTAKGARIRDLRWRGEPVRPDQRFIVATNSYRAGGGGNFTALRRAQVISLPPISLPEMLRRHILSGKARTAPAPETWRFAPQPGQRCLVRTGPGARRYRAELAQRDVTELGTEPDGFLTLSLGL